MKQSNSLLLQSAFDAAHLLRPVDKTHEAAMNAYEALVDATLVGVARPDELLEHAQNARAALYEYEKARLPIWRADQDSQPLQDERVRVVSAIAVLSYGINPARTQREQELEAEVGRLRARLHNARRLVGVLTTEHPTIMSGTLTQTLLEELEGQTP